MAGGEPSDRVTFAVLHLALAADPARTSRLTTALLDAADQLGATRDDLASAVAHAAGDVARRAPDGATLLAAMFAIARVFAGHSPDHLDAATPAACCAPLRPHAPFPAPDRA